MWNSGVIKDISKSIGKHGKKDDINDNMCWAEPQMDRLLTHRDSDITRRLPHYFGKLYILIAINHTASSRHPAIANTERLPSSHMCMPFSSPATVPCSLTSPFFQIICLKYQYCYAIVLYSRPTRTLVFPCPSLFGILPPGRSAPFSDIDVGATYSHIHLRDY